MILMDGQVGSRREVLSVPVVHGHHPAKGSMWPSSSALHVKFIHYNQGGPAESLEALLSRVL